MPRIFPTAERSNIHFTSVLFVRSLRPAISNPLTSSLWPATFYSNAFAGSCAAMMWSFIIIAANGSWESMSSRWNWRCMRTMRTWRSNSSTLCWPCVWSLAGRRGQLAVAKRRETSMRPLVTPKRKRATALLLARMRRKSWLMTWYVLWSRTLPRALIASALLQQSLRTMTAAKRLLGSASDGSTEANSNHGWKRTSQE